jgi:hypothetical protein
LGFVVHLRKWRLGRQNSVQLSLVVWRKSGLPCWLLVAAGDITGLGFVEY